MALQPSSEGEYYVTGNFVDLNKEAQTCVLQRYDGDKAIEAQSKAAISCTNALLRDVNTL